MDGNLLKSSYVRSFVVDSEGSLWVGSEGGGLSKTDVNGNVSYYRHNPNDESTLADNRIIAMTEGSDGYLWIGTDKGWLNRLDIKTGRVKRYSSKAQTGPNNFQYGLVRSVVEDSDGGLWLGIDGAGLLLFDRQKESFKHFFHDPNNSSSLSNNRVFSIYEDSQKELWITTLGGGLNVFEKETNTFKHFRNNPDNKNSLSHDFTIMLQEDAEGIIWVATYGGGVNRFDRSNNQFKRVDGVSGLGNNAVYGIVCDNSGNLWSSHNKGLTRYNPKTEEFRTYDVRDGLQDNEFNSGAYYKGADGKLYFGGIDGFNAFYPDKIIDNPYKPKVVFTDFQVFNKSIGIGGQLNNKVILSQSIGETESITISYKETVFSFEFAALSYVQSSRNSYAYKMEGFEDDWNYVDDRRFVTYTSLAPGDYVFKVKASNNNGLWNEEGIELKIIVTPPFWQTVWFRVLTSTLIIGLLVWGYRYRIRAFNKQKEKLQSILDSRTGDLEEMIGLIKEKSRQISESGDNLKARSGSLAQDAKVQMETAKVIEGDIEKVTQHTRKNSENAKITNEISENIEQKLDGIKTATERNIEVINVITKRIKVLEEIFRQTNILSLNASVEAAHAGDAGSGFAVIAEEVRRLALKSKTASQEIFGSAEEGANETNNVGKLIMDFVPEIQKSAQLIKEISSSSQEQNLTIENVNHSLREFFKTSGQNSSASNEIFKISSELNELGKYLNEKVKDLKI